MTIDCYGRILPETWKADDDMVIAELDMDLLDTSSGRGWMRRRRPELYADIAKTTGKEITPRDARFS